MVTYCLVGFFRKYDDIIRKHPKWVGTFRRQFNSSEFVDNRKWALEALLPRWPGFCGMERSSPIYSELSPEEAIREFDYVVNSIKFVPVWEDNQHERTQGSFKPEGFTDAIIAEVLTTCVLFLLTCCEMLCFLDNLPSHTTSTGGSTRTTARDWSPTFCCITIGFGSSVQPELARQPHCCSAEGTQTSPGHGLAPVHRL